MDCIQNSASTNDIYTLTACKCHVLLELLKLTSGVQGVLVRVNDEGERAEEGNEREDNCVEQCLVAHGIGQLQANRRC